MLYPRSIALDAGSESALAEVVKKWNEHLHSCCKAFAESTPQASVATFSAHAVISDILDNPEEYDFTGDDVMEEGRNIWSDELHFTAEVHNVLAEKIINSLLFSEVDESTPPSMGDGDSGSAKRKHHSDEDLEVNYMDPNFFMFMNNFGFLRRITRVRQRCSSTKRLFAV